MVLVGGWCLFAVFWIDVFLRQSHHWDAAAQWIIGSAIGVPVATALWIAHNRRIYRRKGPRGPVIPGPETYGTDWSGRTVEADWQALRQARVIRISVQDDVKRLTAVAYVPQQTSRLASVNAIGPAAP